ncbi:MAG: sensor histidine kinase [Kiritimatiellaeota bacterium]|nr:sensor histidine kinase [Kiritimatiellota bacterium]
MSSSSSIKRKSRVLARQYHVALRRYLKQGAAASLKPAVRLGHQAVVLELETLDLALIHEQAMIAQALPIGASTARDRIIKRAKTFFAGVILPMEATHRTALEANTHLSRLNQALNLRTLALAASNRQLKKEIARRQVVEETLRQNERHTSWLLEQSRRLQEQLRLLSHRILSVQEEERKRISRELHDVIAQMLTGINVRLTTLKIEAASNTKGLSQKISRTQRLVERSVDIVHRFARELRPAVLDDLGLIPALQSFMKSFTKETGIRVSLTAFTGVEKLSSAKCTVLYRVAHEALTNVARHAQASRVEASIRRLPKAVCMDISDNGKGFDLKRVLFVGRCKRLGLLGIRERVEMVGGKFTVESVPGKGTTIHAQIPFNNGAKEHTHP